MKYRPFLVNLFKYSFCKKALLWLGIYVSSQIYSQPLPNPIAITTDHGLMFRSVHTLLQDQRGLMWISTQKGIQRYDGVEFRTFSSDKKADVLFPGDEIAHNCLLLFNENTLWVLANYLLYSIDLCTYKWKQISNGILKNALIIGIYNSKDGNILITAAEGNNLNLYYYNKLTGAINKVADDIRQGNLLICINTDKSGNIWWSTTFNNLRQFSPDGKLLKSIKPDSFYWYGKKSYYTGFYFDKEDQMYLFPPGKNQVWKYNPIDNTREIILDSLETPVYLAHEDSNNNIWFATSTGLRRYEKHKSGKSAITDLSKQLQDKLDFTNITFLFEDKRNMLWISTNNGLLKLPIRKKQFATHLSNSGSSWGNEIRGIFQSKKGLIYAFCENGQKGLHEINPVTGISKVIYPFGDESKGFSKMELSKKFAIDTHNNCVWGVSESIYKIDLNTLKGEEVIPCKGICEKFNHNPIALLRDGSLIYAARLSNVHTYDPVKRVSSKFLDKVEPEYSQIRTECFEEDRYGNIWIGTISGVFVFDKNGKLLSKIDNQSFSTLSSSYILSLLFDRENNLWVGTFGGGIYKINFYQPGESSYRENSSNIRTIERKEGACDNNITAILEDNNGNIWISTYKGLSYYNIHSHVFQNYYVEDGLTNNEFNYSSSFKDAEGNLWFGGMNGLNVVNPNEKFEKLTPPPLTLCGFSRYNTNLNKHERILINDDYQLDPFIISPYDSWFEFNWALPDYYKSDKNTYLTMLEGIDKSWTYNGTRASIRYHGLPNGDYILRVKSTEMNQSQLAIPIIVLPFFYNTWWFRFSIAVALGMLIYFVFQYKLKKRLEMETMRTQIASDLHDEVGSMLSGLAMQAELLQYNEIQRNEQRLEKISTLSRSAVRKMRDMVWSIDHRRDSLKNLLEKMQEQASDMLQPKDISYRLNVGELPLNKHLPVITRQQLFLIFNEALTNIIRHSNADTVIISIGNVHDEFVMSIFDNGTTFKEGQTSTGLGLSNMKMRAAKINADIHFENHNGFTVTLRMKKF